MGSAESKRVSQRFTPVCQVAEQQPVNQSHQSMSKQIVTRGMDISA